MSKRRKKSRFTKTDVNTICEMQRKIERYESYIQAICGYVQHRGDKHFVCVMRGTDMDSWMEQCWSGISHLFEELEKRKQYSSIVREIEKRKMMNEECDGKDLPDN